jgi:hypothetical protein
VSLEEGLSRQNKPLRPREKLAQYGARFSLTRLEGLSRQNKPLRPREKFA